MNASDFLTGVYMTTFAASGLFFFKFWKASRDRFYLLFATACWLIAVERIAPFFFDTSHDNLQAADAWIYLPRLAAFISILMAILHKNRSTKHH